MSVYVFLDFSELCLYLIVSVCVCLCMKIHLCHNLHAASGPWVGLIRFVAPWARRFFWAMSVVDTATVYALPAGRWGSPGLGKGCFAGLLARDRSGQASPRDVRVRDRGIHGAPGRPLPIYPPRFPRVPVLNTGIWVCGWVRLSGYGPTVGPPWSATPRSDQDVATSLGANGCRIPRAGSDPFVGVLVA